MADFQLALSHIVPSMYRGLEGMVEWNPVSWEDIGGLQDVKQALKQVRKDTSQGCAFCTLSKYLKPRISQFHYIVTRKKKKAEK